MAAPPIEWDAGPGPDPYPGDAPYYYDAGPPPVDASPPPPPNDGGPHPDACALHAYYQDADGDGFGNPVVAVLGCSAPPGYVDNALDCYDGNADAHPGQATWFATHRGDLSFDYDCSGKAEEELPSVDPKICVCGIAGAVGCSVSSGYRSAVPPCGQSGDFAIGGNGQTCDATVIPVTQMCR
jgi:hypothetical protein